jgi:predicted branched-subunit amino acid permease
MGLLYRKAAPVHRIIMSALLLNVRMIFYINRYAEATISNDMPPGSGTLLTYLILIKSKINHLAI